MTDALKAVPAAPARDPAERIRVAYYCDAHVVGGAEVSLGHLLELASPRIEIVLIGTDAAVVDRIAARRPGVESVVLPEVHSRWDVGAIAAHARALWRARPDVLHVSLNRPWGAKWAILPGLLLPGVKVVAVEKLPRWSPRLRHRAYKRLTSRFLDAHVTLGEQTAHQVAALAGVPRERIRTIPSGVPDEPLAESPPPIPRIEGAVIGSLGRLEPQKGLDVLVRALAELPGLTAVLVGEGSERSNLIDLADSLGVADRLILAGWSERPRSYLAGFDLYVQPSRFEAQGLGIVEAMLAGLPVVASDVGGIGDVVVAGQTGTLVPPDDPEALAVAIRGLLADEDARVAMGGSGRERAVANFTAEAMTRRFEELYAELVG